MDSNETIRPLTEVPVEQTSETLVSSSATAEENNATYVPKVGFIETELLQAAQG